MTPPAACPHCRAPLPAGASGCPTCGAPVLAVPVARKIEVGGPPPAGTKNGAVVVFVLLGCGGLFALTTVAVAAVFWLLMPPRVDDAEVPPPPIVAEVQPVPPPVAPATARRVAPATFPLPPPRAPWPPVPAAVPPPKPEPPPVPAGPPLPPFAEAPNPYKPGTQTRLRELRVVDLPAAPKAPDNPHPAHVWMHEQRLAFAPAAGLLFVLRPRGVWVYDTVAGKPLGEQRPKEQFTDLSLAPDGSALFAADYGGEVIGYNRPSKPSWLHRFDGKSRTWEVREAPKIAFRAEAVDGLRVLLLERDQWVSVSLNRWEEDGVGVRELARIGSDYGGDMEYDPRTGRIYHAARGITSAGVSVRELRWDKLAPAAGAGGLSGGGIVLSRDGQTLYSGARQLAAAEPSKLLQTLPDIIVAASRDVAFGTKAYYRATTGSKLGNYPAPVGRPAQNPFDQGPTPVVHVSPDGMSVWTLDPEKNAARQYALEGEK